MIYENELTGGFYEEHNNNNSQKTQRGGVLLYLSKYLLSVLIVAFVFLCIYKMDGIYHRLSYIRDQITERIYYRERNRITVSLDEYAPLQDEEDAWYLNYHFIAHAGGEIDGYIYTGSLEAWEESYRKGSRVFDADFNWTADGKLVIRHSWSDNLETDSVAMNQSRVMEDKNGCIQRTYNGIPLSYEAFMNSRIFHRYSPMDAEAVLRFMDTHADVYVAADTKGDIMESYRVLVTTAKGLRLESVLKRIIVNVYDCALIPEIKQIYPFSNFTARQHYVQPKNYSELAKECLDNGVHVVSISSCYMNDEGIRLLREKGIHVWAAIADYISDLSEYAHSGAEGAVTNYLCENDWIDFIEE